MKEPLDGLPTSINDTYGPKQQSNDDFMREAAVWARVTKLTGDHVVRLFDYNIDPHPWMVMEVAEGSLSDAMARGEVGISSIMEILEDLQAVHSVGYIHRDIKPANILRVNGRWELSDFGLSKGVGTPTGGVVRGTVEYMAPEQIQPRILGGTDIRTDIWQTGILLYHLVVGRTPYPEVPPDAIGFSICLEGPDLESVSEEYRSILGKALSQRKEERYQSIEDFADAVKEVISGGRTQNGWDGKSTNTIWKLKTEFDRAMNDGRTVSAKRIIGELERISPNDKELSKLKEWLNRVNCDIAGYLASYEASIHCNYPYRAYLSAQHLSSVYPEEYTSARIIRDSVLEIYRKVQIAKMWCQKASETDLLEKKVNYYGKAMEACRDYPDVLDFSANHQPEPPKFKVSETINGKTITISPQEDSFGVTYCIYKWVKAPRSLELLNILWDSDIPDMSDAKKIAEINELTYVDQFASFDEESAYLVKSKRLGVESKGFHYVGPMNELHIPSNNCDS